MIISPPFFQNFDYWHCLQVSTWMVLHANGDTSTFEEIEKLTNFDKDLYSWGLVAASLIQAKIPGTVFYSGADYRKFALQGKSYLKESWNQFHYLDQEKHASKDFIKEQNAAKNFFKQGGILKNDKLTEDTLSKLLQDNILIALISAVKFYPSVNSGSHFIVIYGETADKYIIHDSGFSSLHKGKKGWKVAKQQVLASIAEVIAVPKKEPAIGTIIGKKDECYCGSKKFFKKCHRKVLMNQELLLLD